MNEEETPKFSLPNQRVFQYSYARKSMSTTSIWILLLRIVTPPLTECGSCVTELCDLTNSPEAVAEALNSIPRHPCIVEYKEVIKVEGGPVYVAMEDVEYDLNSYLQANKEEEEPPCRIKWMMKRLLEGVKCLHDNGVIHWHLKPASILISKDGTQLKICDLELLSIKARGTLSYTAPEVLAGAEVCYSTQIDLWAVGCIMAELITKEVLFDKEREEDVDDDVMENIKHREDVYDDVIENVKQSRCIYVMKTEPYPLLTKFTALLTPSGYDLLDRLLRLSLDRITAEDALNHSWFEEEDD